MAESMSTERYVADHRAHELFQYFQPDNPAVLSGNAPCVSPSAPKEAQAPHCPNVLLTAIAQLAALKTGTKRALISVVSQDTLYVVTEASKSLSLSNNDESEKDDGILVGCSTGPLNGTLCQRTVSLPPAPNGEYPFYIVNDMGTHEEIKHFPYVVGPPYLRFYAGTPLTTAKGINIGTLCVVDYNPKEGLNSQERDLLGTLAKAVVEYLDTSRQALEGSRLVKLLSGLNSFVQGTSGLSNSVDDHETTNPEHLMPNTDTSDHTQTSRVGGRPGTSRSLPKNESTEPPCLETQDQERPKAYPASAKCSNEHETKKHKRTLDPRDWVFQRAANLLRESLDLGDDGGVIFVSANDILHNDGHNLFLDPSYQTSKAAKTLALSTERHPFATWTSSQIPSCQATQLHQGFLERILRRFPKGQFWYFHDDGSRFSFSDDEDDDNHGVESDNGSLYDFKRPVSPEKRDLYSSQLAKEEDASVLKRIFPQATRIIFAPLWDAVNSRWYGGCFCWSSVETRVFSVPVELGSVFGFGSSVMVELSRLESLESDRCKGNFLNNISHELRSPLHGILAATELLSEQNIAGLPKSLLGTIQSCGQTLLDTFEQILDFSKINAFQRKRLLPNKIKAFTHYRSSNSAESELRSLNLVSVADIALIAEEVVESVCSGYAFSTASVENPDVPAHDAFPFIHRKEGTSLPRNEVDVTLDIDPNDWVFVTETGAIRRIIMNIFGNSLKYTSKGSICVKLELSPYNWTDEGDDTSRVDIITFTVSDTGKGISDEYMRSRMYTPFSQEDDLAPGTGLGLSIVRSVVKALNGNINITSQSGVGTVVKVSLPLTRPTTGELTQLEDRSDSQRIDHSEILGEGMRGRKIAVVGQSTGKSDETTSTHLISKYITDWFGLKLVTWRFDPSIDFLIIHEARLAEVLGHNAPLPRLLVLCHGGFDHSRRLLESYGYLHRAELALMPWGPYKLARILRGCLNNAAAEVAPADRTIERRRRARTMDLSTTNWPIYGADLKQLPGGGISLFAFRSSPSETESSQTQHLRKTKNVQRLHGIDTHTVIHPTATLLPSPLNTTFVWEGLRVLLVDDNPINLNLLETFMKRKQPLVLHTATNGKEAVEAVRIMADGYDYIFMDMSMPIMNGFEATKAIRRLESERADPKPAVIIAVTGLGSAQQISEAYAAGVNHFLTKPVSFRKIGELLRGLQESMNSR